MKPERRRAAEERRIRVAYEHYSANERDRRWSLQNPANGLIRRERLEVLQGLIKAQDVSLGETTILDVGCGSGGSMEDWVLLGASRRRVIGVDLLFDRLVGLPQGAVGGSAVASAHQLPFRDESFHLVSLFTTLSSILDDDLQSAVGGEILRVLKQGGRIVCYDMRIPNPSNSHTRHISLRHLKRLFPSGQFESRTLTVVPQLARRLGRTPSAYRRWSVLPILRSHRLTAISFPDVTL